MTALTQTSSRPLTGRTVLLSFVAFFGIIFAANVVLVRAALTSFGGVETESAYKAGLAFKGDKEAAAAQDARGWRVEAALSRGGDGTRTIAVTARDANGAPLAGLVPQARLSHPTDAKRDRVLSLTEAEPGRFIGAAEAAPGQWDLVIVLMRGEEQVFRSKSRLTL